jgi:hypothetical protein
MKPKGIPVEKSSDRQKRVVAILQDIVKDVNTSTNAQFESDYCHCGLG